MTLFWLAAIAMLIVAMAFILPPLFGKSSARYASGDQLNVSVFEQRVAELQADLDNGVLSEPQFDHAKRDLEAELLSDLDAQTVRVGEVSRPAWLVVGCVAAMVPVIAVMMYFKLGTVDPVEAQRLAEAARQQTTAANGPSPEVMVESLQARLEQKPDDVEGWGMLGRSLVVLERFEEAAAAYGKANELKPADAVLMIGRAEALALSKGGDFSGESATLLQRALQLEPENQRALWFGGLASYQAADYPAAVKRWEKLAGQYAPDSREGRLIAEGVARALESMGETSGMAVASTAETAAGVAVEGGITVSVSLDDAMVSNVAATDSVFIFAKALSGPPMPLAVVRRQVQDLPLNIILDDSQAMTPEMVLSGFEEVEVVARVSKSGGPIAQSGDLQGTVAKVSTRGGEAIKLIIDSVVP